MLNPTCSALFVFFFFLLFNFTSHLDRLRWSVEELRCSSSRRRNKLFPPLSSARNEKPFLLVNNVGVASGRMPVPSDIVLSDNGALMVIPGICCRPDIFWWYELINELTFDRGAFHKIGVSLGLIRLMVFYWVSYIYRILLLVNF